MPQRFCSTFATCGAHSYSYSSAYAYTYAYAYAYYYYYYYYYYYVQRISCHMVLYLMAGGMPPSL